MSVSRRGFLKQLLAAGGAGAVVASGGRAGAIEEFHALVEEFPSDSAGLANLAVAYFLKRDMGRALEQGRRAVELSPKNVLQRNNVVTQHLAELLGLPAPQ